MGLGKVKVAIKKKGNYNTILMESHQGRRLVKCKKCSRRGKHPRGETGSFYGVLDEIFLELKGEVDQRNTL